MKKIIVDEIENGMVLAKDVNGASGNALLGKGTTLSATMGRRLKNWGIPFVYVDGEEENHEESTENGISPEEIKSILSKRFEGVLKIPRMADIFDAVLQFKKTPSN